MRRSRGSREIREGSWAEALILTLLTFQILIVPLLAIVLVLGLLGLTIWALATTPLLAVVPIAILVGLMWRFAIYMKEPDEEDVEGELLGPGRRL